MAWQRLAGYTQVTLLIVTTMAQDTSVFNMFPAVDSGQLAQSLGWSEACVVAMNATLNCDSDLYRMVGQIDTYLWTQDNITALCTLDCINKSSDWITAVETACGGQTYNVGGRLAPVDTVPLRYVEGITLACSKSDDLPFNFTSNPDTNEQSWVDDDIGNPNSTTPLDPFTGDPIFDPDDVPSQDNDTDDDSEEATDSLPPPSTDYCFLKSQNWPGVDPNPDCDADPSNIFCTDPDSMDRLANLYYDDVLCDPCFLTTMWYRVNSAFLPDTDDSDWLIEQYQDIQDVCQISMPESVIRALPGYAPAPNATYLFPGTDPAEPSSIPSSDNTCTGQTIPAGSGCDDLSHKYGVSTGDLRAAAGTDDCSFSGTICVASACTLSQVAGNNSCDDLAASASTSTLNLTTSLFLQWNPNILGLCDSLAEGQYVCSSPPGGLFALPPPIDGVNADASGQDRGGQGPLGAAGPTANSTSSAPTTKGIVADCNKFAYVSSGDTCYQFTQSFGISMTQLTAWNPVLGAPDGHNCSTQFWAGYDYCVGTAGADASSSSAAHSSTSRVSSTGTSVTAPGPTQSGIVVSCNQYLMANDGNTCTAFASRARISLPQLYAWNSVLGPNGENCGTQFWGQEYYCVGVSQTSVSSSSTTTSITAPGPTQSGIIASCTKYLMANDGGTCTAFASRAGISLTQLYAWNTILGPNGENCGTQFWGQEYYCVGVSQTSGSPTSSKSSSTTTSIIAPGPTQSGIVSNCNTFLMANPGGSCSVFASRAGISTSQLYAWNPILGNNGENCASQFWGNEYYCVGVSQSSVTPTSKSTAPTTTSITAPGPTQTGISKKCIKFLMANPGGSCSVFASRAGITTAQLYAWNTVLGQNGENCATQFWGNEYYCVGVSG